MSSEKAEEIQNKIEKGKEKANKLVDFFMSKQEKIISFRNKGFKTGSFSLLLAVLMYGFHLTDTLTGLAYAIQVFAVVISIPFFVVAFAIFFAQLYIETQVDNALGVLSAGGFFRSMILGEVKDKAVESITEKSEERRTQNSE